MFFELPDKNAWNAIEEANWLESVEVKDNDFDFLIQPEDSPSRLASHLTRFTWRLDLQNRIYQTRWTYVILLYLFEKGIPDDEWLRSPGRDGFSTEYFPHFEHDDHIRKAQFDYFADIFYYKLYSALDVIGHLLNTIYELGIAKPRVDFHRAVATLTDVRPELQNRLQAIIDTPDFQETRRLRMGAVHNERLGSVGVMAHSKDENHVSFGTGVYIISRQIMDNARRSVELLRDILTVIREQLELDKTKAVQEDGH